MAVCRPRGQRDQRRQAAAKALGAGAFLDDLGESTTYDVERLRNFSG